MIPYGRQLIDEQDIAAVVETLRSDWLTQGPAVEQFEVGLADYCQAKHAVACNSGTAALHMAYEAAGIGPGKIVVVPTNTFLATANAAIYLGAEVRFCDVDPNSGLMTPETLAKVLDSSVNAIVPVHFAGQACDMEGIGALRRQLAPDAVIIEDASHAIGGQYANGAPIGNCQYAAMATFSFHPVKHIAAGEGGAVMTNQAELNTALQRFRCHGMTKEPALMQRPQEGSWYYEMHSPGMNYRIPDLCCALANSQLKKLDQSVAKRRQIAEAYFRAWQHLPGLTLPSFDHRHQSAWHLFCVHFEFEQTTLNRQTLMTQLKQVGIGTQVHYYPVSHQPFYQSRYQLSDSHCPGAVAHYRRAISLPMFPAMSSEDIQHVCQQVAKLWRENTKSTAKVA